MLIRLFAVLIVLASCTGSGPEVTKSVEISAARLAEIRENSYAADSESGRYGLAALAGFQDDSRSGGILFTGFGRYLHEMGFRENMVITEIDGVGVAGIFADRWRSLRLQDPSAFDAMHYNDLIEYLFLRDSKAPVLLTIDVNVSVRSFLEGQHEAETEVWKINFP